MAHTVVALYDNYTDGQQALNALTRSGFSQEQASLSPGEDTRDARDATLRTPHQDEGGVTGTISGFFRSLFGSVKEDRHTDIYSEAVRRGSYLLTVHTDSDEQNDRATEIINRYQPVDIDERAGQWQSQGWSGYDASAPALTDAEIQQERTRYAGASMQSGKREVQRGRVRVFQRAVETPMQEQAHEPASEADLAALKNASFDVRETVSDTLGRTDVEVDKMGNSPDSATGATSATFNDNDCRRHWQNTYGSSGARYEDYAPAYQYGYQMAGGERYRNYHWADAEPEVRQQWESSNAGHPWERVKDAIRYGWEKVTR